MLLSIIVPVYNVEQYLPKCLDSLLEQNIATNDYEIIVIIDGSTDRSLVIAKEYADKHQNIKIIIQENQGLSGARNTGINHATGEIIGIINSDDLLLPEAISAIACNYEPNVNVYRGNIIIWNSKTNQKKKEIPSMTFPLWNMLPKLSHPGTFITKFTYEKYGYFDKNFKYMMDWNLLTQLYQKNVIFKYIDVDIVLFRLGGVTSTDIRKKKEEIKKYFHNNGGGYIHFMMFYYPRLLLQGLRRFFKDNGYGFISVSLIFNRETFYF